MTELQVLLILHFILLFLLVFLLLVLLLFLLLLFLLVCLLLSSSFSFHPLPPTSSSSADAQEEAGEESEGAQVV